MAARRKPKKRPSGPSGANLHPGYLLRMPDALRASCEAAAGWDGRSLADWMRRALARAAAEDEIRRSLDADRAALNAAKPPPAA